MPSYHCFAADRFFSPEHHMVLDGRIQLYGLRYSFLLMVAGVPFASSQSAPTLIHVNPTKPVLTTVAPRFEVASIRPSRSGQQQGVTTALVGSRYYARNQSIWSTIMLAYFPLGPSTWSNQLKEVPSWVTTELYTIDATIDAGVMLRNRSEVEQRALLSEVLKTLLAERFKLALQSSEGTTPVYQLVVKKRVTSLQIAVPTAQQPQGSVKLNGGVFATSTQRLSWPVEVF